MIKEIKFTDKALKQITNLLSKKDKGENLMKHSGIPHQQGESREDFIHALKKKRRGFVVTSFSRLQKEREHGRNSNPGRDSNFTLPHFEARVEDDFEDTREADEPESINAESPASSKQADPSTLKLPGGASTGNFLHEILERIDYAQVLGSTSAEEWAQFSGCINSLPGLLKNTDFQKNLSRKPQVWFGIP